MNKLRSTVVVIFNNWVEFCFTSSTNDPISTHNVSMSSITDSVPDSVETRHQVDEHANLTNDLFPSEPEKTGKKEDNDAHTLTVQKESLPTTRKKKLKATFPAV